MSKFKRMEKFPTNTNGEGFFPHANGFKSSNQKEPKVCDTCPQMIFVNLFFDGTANHRSFDRRGGSYTNVARLFEASEGLSPGAALAEQNASAALTGEERRYKFYLQGVGTQFRELGEDAYSTLGKGTAVGFGMRVGWAYTRVLNAVYHAITRSTNPLFSNDEARTAATWWDVQRTGMSVRRALSGPLLIAYDYAAGRNLIADKLAKLAKTQQQAPKNKQVGKVWISAFGFSRGAAGARVFVSQLMKEWGTSQKLAGVIDYEVSFLGIFDTVASVGGVDGLRTVLGAEGFDGHWAWCNKGALNVPPNVPCLHMVAINEQRRSFPLDTIRMGKEYAAKHQEIGCPGVHSDVGGGYPPGDQGKARKSLLSTGAPNSPLGRNLSLKMGQIPLHYMYKAALEAGVPLRLKEQMSAELQADFRVDENLVKAVNDWISQTPDFSDIEAALTYGFKQSMAWHTLRAQKSDYITGKDFYKNAPESGAQRPVLQKQYEDKIRSLEKQQVKLSQQAQNQMGGVFVDQSTQSGKEIWAQRSQTRAELDKLTNLLQTPDGRAKVMDGVAGKPEGSMPPGGDVGDILPQDKKDLLEGNEEFQLLLGYLYPEQQPGLGVIHSTTTETIRVDLTPTKMAQTIERWSIRHADPLHPDNVPPASAKLLIMTQSGLEAMALDGIVMPEPDFVPFLKECTSKTAWQAMKANEAACTLFDDYMHDSRAWFRTPTFHEPTPGGYGWPRAFYIGSDTRVEYLGRKVASGQATQVSRKIVMPPSPPKPPPAPPTADIYTPPVVDMNALFNARW
ncbi:DUF2235 domain-containing protein [Silvimonas sp.]|uniref:T6SS phospholipase effector Tle1-like catalytic domain-containing protein n=1 Tax=Silvimonas sp. TaxID=2650811 RepID=UPI00284F164A|nr:DUF2235 domain-containing protein [Silvimonas sp.]MDR3428735.1 DUF2235 domain-containing protein [Silvimonas sp.]